MSVYEGFNYLEGVIWWVVAIAVFFKVKAPQNQQKIGLFVASIGFMAFGCSDFFEATRAGEIPWWLWLLKIGSGFIIVCGRFTFLGWENFSFKDRVVRFGVFCLIAVFALIGLQQILARLD